MAVMSPGNALDRVVYLKDRALEESRRVAAYGKARDLVRELGDDEIVRRHGEGTLQELPGIGPSTAKVISLAIDGGIDVYRSAEHTSELPSLMRISYAVFSLTQKNYHE